MKIHSPLFLLAALGVLSAPGIAAAAPDTSRWKCETCPYPKGTTGAVDVGAWYTKNDSPTFGNYTGLGEEGLSLDLGGHLMHRGENGYYADLLATDLGIDTRFVDAQAGREGLYNLRVSYGEIPRYFAEGARTPFIGSGGGVLTLPAGAGFPAGDTTSMPLAATLQPVELGYEARRFDLGGTWIGPENWSFRADLRRDVRDGTKPIAGSFFSTASQLAAPVDYTTDQLEVAASYATRQLQATVAYHLSQFRNGVDSLTWDNPFLPVNGAARGELAQAPDNQFHQLVGSIGYQVMPELRASGDIAIGRGTQNAAFRPSTLNPGIAPLVPGLPAASLDGRVDTYNGNVKLTYTPIDDLRVNAIYAWDVRDNRSDVLAYPMVSTDMFLQPDPVENTPFDLTRNRFKLNADYRGLEAWKLNGGIDWDQQERNYHEAVTTRETTLWGRASVQALENLGLAFKLAYGDRDPSTYGIAYWFPAQNPLMRKVNLAARQRSVAEARADWAATEELSMSLVADYTRDDYDKTVIGLQEARTTNLAADISYALSEETRLYGFAQGQRMDSRQTGSQTFAAPDWTGTVKDEFGVLGLGVKHAAIPDKLEIGADISFARGRSDIATQTALGEPPFPTAKTSLDVVKIYANYRVSETLSILGSLWYEAYDAVDWRLDGVQPDTVYNLLAFGNQAPQYYQTVLRVALRYQF